MSNTICLNGPAFSLTGNLSSISQAVDFQLSFNSSADEDTVLAYQWYLDGNVITGQNSPEFDGAVPGGMHTIGARILTASGWSGVKTLSFQTNRIPVSTVINGPASVDEGSSADYSITATFPDQTTLDVTGEYTLSCPDGTFTGDTFTAALNNIYDDSRQSTITASKDGYPDVTKQITINDTTVNPPLGVLVVDLYNDASLNAIGFIANPEVTESHQAAYTGNNFVPAAATAAGALVLSSDFIDQTVLKRRFEFNVAQLVTDYPDSAEFTFYIMGRSATAGSVSGAFNLKTTDAVMTMTGTPGSYIPAITGGSNVGSLTNFNTQVVAGANGSYAEGNLTTMIQLVYHVATKTITYTTDQSSIQINNFDYMSVKYQWILEGGTVAEGTDLDILVGFENNGTSIDGQYVGFGQGTDTIPGTATPQNTAYLWWAADSTSNSGSEDVLIGMKRFVTDFPSTPDVIEVGLYAVWYGTPGNGNFTVQLNTYLGGTMSVLGTDFINTGGTPVSSNTIARNTLIHSTSHTPATSYKVGSIQYTKSTQSAIIQLS